MFLWDLTVFLIKVFNRVTVVVPCFLLVKPPTGMAFSARRYFGSDLTVTEIQRNK